MARTRRAAGSPQGEVPAAEDPASTSSGRGRVRSGNASAKRRGTGVITPKRAQQWDATFAQATAWVREHGRFPKNGSPDQVERALRNWMYDNLPGKCSFRPERLAKLNSAFGGEGWVKDFCPGFGGGKGGPPKGHITARRALLWATMLADAEVWVKDNGRYPDRCTSDTAERALADWLYNNLPGRQGWRPERWENMNAAFGEGWEKHFNPGFGGGRSVKGIKPKQAAKWAATFDEVKEWARDKGGYPDPKSSDRAEKLLGKWLYDNLPGRARFQPGRWKLLNEAFKEKWELDFCPGFGTRK